MRILHSGISNRLRTGLLAGLAIGVVVVATACGDADTTPPVTTPTPAGSPTASPEPLPTPSPGTVPPVASPTPVPSPTVVPTSSPVPTRRTGPTSIDVRWHDGTRFVGGTLDLPPGSNLPAVLLVADGGGADRDWVSPSLPGLNGSGRLIASALSDAGYATLRYDRRGTGRSGAVTAPVEGENFLSDSVAEVASAVAFLKTRPEVDPDRVFIAAHDEGALHVLLREGELEQSDVAGIAMLSPSALSFRQQVIRRLGQLAEGPEDEPFIAAFDAAMALFIEDALPEEDPGFSPSLQGLFENLTHPTKLPYNAEIWNLQPVPLLRETTVPVLILIGQLDVHTEWLVEGPMWEDGVSPGQDVEFVYPLVADHVLKATNPASEETGLSTYNAFGRVLDAEAIDALIEWLDARSRG